METVKGSLEALAQTFTERMTSFEKELKKASPNEAVSLDSLVAEYNNFRTFVVSALRDLQKEVTMLTAECDSIEMRSRRKMLLLHGVPEQQNEKASEVVVDIARKHLSLVEVDTNSFSQAHRMGRGSNDKPRPILVKFRSREVRDKAWFAKVGLKGSGITLSEFLTRRRHQVFMAARDRVGVSRCWTSEGRIVVLGDDGKRYRINSVADLESTTAIAGSSKPSSGQAAGISAVKPAAKAPARAAARAPAKKK